MEGAGECRKGRAGEECKSVGKGEGEGGGQVQKKTVPCCIDSDSESEEDTTLTPELEAIWAASWSEMAGKSPRQIVEVVLKSPAKGPSPKKRADAGSANKAQEKRKRGAEDKEPVSNKTPRATKRAKPDPTPEPETEPEPELPAVTTQKRPPVVCNILSIDSLQVNLCPAQRPKPAPLPEPEPEPDREPEPESEPETQPGGYPETGESAPQVDSTLKRRRSGRLAESQSKPGAENTQKTWPKHWVPGKAFAHTSNPSRICDPLVTCASISIPPLDIYGHSRLGRFISQ
ncbi:hypothetical protein AG1IA_08517 [Rhizoctonia solani AG-1 IA]|uniref:Uncharacterized protein n=1 Tax=Thanatephorus cucumeris (strain AG1-IA) TaxID=983506 RepID=L8WL38_THACA|nr:hypothetical protein AG1IA_08517 [Rhizoctonia solani AG-1 IA]